ncbi:MAG TPA: hypothetical protein VM933_01010, partial [Acidimicrobiales bacterium]|nr:hypothetical protein [Acidimicrobiales bacterium]
RLVDVDDVDGLATALGEVLGDPARAAALGREGRRRAERLDPAAEFENGVERLAAWVASGR